MARTSLDPPIEALRASAGCNPPVVRVTDSMGAGGQEPPQNRRAVGAPGREKHTNNRAPESGVIGAASGERQTKRMHADTLAGSQNVLR